MQHKKLTIVLLLAAAASAFPALLPIRPPTFGAATTAAAQDVSAAEPAPDLDRPVRRLIPPGRYNDSFSAGAPHGLFGLPIRGAIRLRQVGASQGSTEVEKNRCVERLVTTACWEELANHQGCYFWNDAFDRDRRLSWTGECSRGLAQGIGDLQWTDQESPVSLVPRRSLFHRGELRDGKKDGHWVEGGFGGVHGARNEGPYVAGEKHGHWIHNLGGRLIFEGPYVNGLRHGHWVERERALGIVAEGSYDEGERHGQWITRDRDGNIVDQERYVRGRLQSR